MIRRYIKYFFLVVFSLFFQSALGHSDLFVPDLLLLLVVALAFSSYSVAGVILAFFLGLLSDLASGVYLGPFAAAYVCAFCFASMVSKRVFADRLLAIMGVTFLSCIVKSVVFSIFIFYFVPISFMSLLNYKVLFVEAIFTTLFSPIIFRIILGKFFARPQNRSSISLSFSRALR